MTKSRISEQAFTVSQNILVEVESSAQVENNGFLKFEIEVDFLDEQRALISVQMEQEENNTFGIYGKRDFTILNWEGLHPLISYAFEQIKEDFSIPIFKTMGNNNTVVYCHLNVSNNKEKYLEVHGIEQTSKLPTFMVADGERVFCNFVKRVYTGKEHHIREVDRHVFIPFSMGD